MFNKILIANRGEIAVRIARTARRLGVETVAVYSDADARAPHVRACDEAVLIGGAAPAESYLVAARIIDAARETGADAIHPGYGFLSENADFAEALDAAGIVFIGPTAKTIRAMGSKSAAKDLMEAAGVPTTPGYQGADQSLDTFAREADRIGYPVLLKATAGGGGKGMRIVHAPDALAEALAAAQREAKSAFGDDRFLIEKYVERARHLEVQVFGDGAGNVVHMYERDCSVQRRHQKIIEEAPAPDLPAQTRAQLLKAGVDAARAVDYRGAGTVEFLYDPASADKDGGVYFMEMNTRLQVEHPVSEEITGFDFVEWQLRIAAGEGLPCAQEDIRECGHAFEARLYAENPAQNFAPSIGRITRLALPEGARIDSGVEEGQEITPYYDPMIAKIITHGGDRAAALGAMRAALRETRAAGLETNAAFLARLAGDADFRRGAISTRYIDEHRDTLFHAPALDAAPMAALSIYLIAQALHGGHDGGKDGEKDGHGDAAQAGFRLNAPRAWVFWIVERDVVSILRLSERSGGDGVRAFEASIEPDAGAASRRSKEGPATLAPLSFSFTTPTSTFMAGTADAARDIRIAVDGRAVSAHVAAHTDDTVRVWIGAEHWTIARADPLDDAAVGGAAEGSLTAPMPGVVTLLKAAPGDSIEAGGAIIVMEAMKMEHTVSAPHAGVIKAFRFQPGDQVKEGDLLVEFDSAEG